MRVFVGLALLHALLYLSESQLDCAVGAEIIMHISFPRRMEQEGISSFYEKGGWCTCTLNLIHLSQS